MFPIMLAHGPDLICVAGDMVNSGNVLSEWHDYWFKPLEHLNFAQTRPVIFARGNHDGEHALAYAYSTLPGNEAWFAFDYGNSRFIFLDSEMDTGGSPEQFAWLQAELARPETQRAAFRIVCFHRPPYANLWNGGGYTGETVRAQRLGAAFRAEERGHRHLRPRPQLQSRRHQWGDLRGQRRRRRHSRRGARGQLAALTPWSIRATISI